MDWIGLAQGRDRWRTLVSAVMKLLVACNTGNFLTSCKPVSFSRRILHHTVSKLVKYKVNNAILQLLHKLCVPPLVIYNPIKTKDKSPQCDVKAERGIEA